MAAPDQHPPHHSPSLGDSTRVQNSLGPPESIKLPPPPQPSPPSPDLFLSRRRILDGVLVAVVLGFAFLVALFPVRNSDLLTHLATGRLISQGQYPFGEDPFSFASRGAYWANHSWLFGLGAYALYEVPSVGPTVLLLLKALLVVALAEVMLRLGSRAGQSLWVTAACVGLAILVVSARIFLQPVVLSYLFLGLTLLLLESQRSREKATADGSQAPWDVRWLIPLLCALWVNLDAWFLLGPLTVGLYLLGEWLEEKTMPAARRPGAHRSHVKLIVVLAVSIAACLINPFHVHAFTLPAQLGLSPAGSVLAEDDMYRRLFYSPLQEEYWHNSNLGANVAGLSYYILVVVCATSFALGGTAWRDWRGTVTLPFLLLSLWHFRAIPFFAVVAGPVSGLNFLEFAARKFGTAPWLEGGGRRWALGGRAMTIVVGLLMLLLSWPGWLQAYPREQRRVGWEFRFDPDLEEAAQQIARWRKEGLLVEGSGWFNTTPDTVGDYLAWYAPGERVFADLRVSLYDDKAAADYSAARNSLLSPDLSPPEERAGKADAWQKVFQEWGIRYVFLVDNRISGHNSTAALLIRARLSPDQWTICSLNGRSMLLAWKDPKEGQAGANPYARLRWDRDRAAFGPGAEAAPPNRPLGSAEAREWWAALWQPEPVFSSPTERAFVTLLDFDLEAQLARSMAQSKIGFEALSVLGTSSTGLGAGLGGALANGAALGAILSVNGEYQNYFALSYANRYLLLRDEGPPADLYLTVRAARRALAENPADARAYFVLGKAYTELKDRTRERTPGYQSPYLTLLRQTQALAALNRAVALNPNEDRAHELLSQLYQQFQGEQGPQQVPLFDLWLKHSEELLRIRRDGESYAPVGPNSAKQLEQLEARNKQLREEVDRRSNQFEIKAANRPAVEKARVALGLGLAKRALEVVQEEIRQTQPDDSGPQAQASLAQALGIETRLLILMGKLEDAREHLSEELKPVFAHGGGGVVPAEGAYDWRAAELAVSSGDYEAAGRHLAAIDPLLALVPLPEGGKPEGAALVLPRYVGYMLLTAATQAAHHPVPPTKAIFFPTVIQMSQTALARQADLQTVRAALALEAGDLPSARKQLIEVLERTGHRGSAARVEYPSGRLAEMYLEWLDAAAR